MGSFIILDRQKLLNGELGVRESSGKEIAFFELGKSLGIKLGLELFQNVRKSCERGLMIKVSFRHPIENIKGKEIWDALMTRRFAALSCLLTGAAAAKSGTVARAAKIEVEKRIVFIGGWTQRKRSGGCAKKSLGTLLQKKTKGRPAG